jgi:phage terminase large subunit-like protein
MSDNKANVAQLLNTTAGRRALGSASSVFFDSHYLKMRKAPHRTNWLKTIDRLEAEAKQSNDKKKLLVLAPRSHGKSLLAISYAVRKICMDRNISILFISASAGQAEKRVRLIKQYLDDDKIVGDWANGEDMPKFRDKDSKWTSTQLYVQRNGTSVDPTIEAIGVGGKITGAHVDIVIFDDLEDDLTTASAGVRSKTREWLGATVTPILNQGGLMLVIGTRKHDDDLYSHMKNDPTFEVIEDPAILKWPEKYEYIIEADSRGREVLKGVKVEGDYEVLWPEFRPIEYLLMERRSMGATLFAREMMNQPLALESAVIKPEWVKRNAQTNYSLGTFPPNLDISECTVVQSWDLSIESDSKKAAKNDSDFTVGYTLCRDEQGNVWVIDVFRDRGLTQTEILNAISSMYNKFSDYVRCVIVEKNSFGNLYVNQLQRTSMPVKGIAMTRHNALKVGIHKVAVLFENNFIKFPIGDERSRNVMDEFINEASLFPVAKHDDLLDSLYHGLNELQKSFGDYSIAIGEVILNHKGERIAGNNTHGDVVTQVLNEKGITKNDDIDEWSEEDRLVAMRFGLID